MTTESNEKDQKPVRYLLPTFRVPTMGTCPSCFALVDLDHLAAHEGWHETLERDIVAAASR